MKTESKLGNKEYSPSKNFYGAVLSEEQEKLAKEQEEYIKDLVKRLKTFKPKSVLPFSNGLYSFLIKLTDPEKLVWEWNDEAIDDCYFLTLREIVVMLENARELKNK